MALVQQIADLDAQQDELDHQFEMEQVDEDAEQLVQHEARDEEKAFAGIEADIWQSEGTFAAPKLKNKDSSDDECACAPPKVTKGAEAKILAKQTKKIADAKKAKANAIAAKAAAETAITAANVAKKTSAKNVLELQKVAEEAISKATVAENRSIKKQTEAHTKTTVNAHEKYDLATKTVVKTWEETVVSKHEVWETYKSIKKNFRIAVTNVKLVRQNLKAAENKVVQLRKTSALNPKDVGAREKVKEAEALVSVIRKQLLDATNQNVKVDEEKNAAQVKAREASVASAKAKANAERAFRKMVVDNNQVCSLCRLGKEKIAKRRLEIDGAIKQETKLKAQREAEKRRQSRGRGGHRAASLTQESVPNMPVVPQAPAPQQLAEEQSTTHSHAQATKHKKHHKKVQQFDEWEKDEE